MALPQVRRAMEKYRNSPENAARLAAMNRSPEARGRPRAPETLENLARWQQSPECSARMAEYNKVHIGAEHESFDLPDPDWCQHHDVSRYDHKANSACRYACSTN